MKAISFMDSMVTLIYVAQFDLQVSDERVKNLSSLYSENDYVYAVIKSIDAEKQKITLGIKPSYFTAGDLSDEEEEEDQGEGENDDEGKRDEFNQYDVLSANEETN